MSEAEIDRALVVRVQQGERGAFDILVRKYEQRLFKLIGRYIRDEAEVFDVAQESFLKAFRALPNFRGESAFYTWLYRIAINTAKNHLVAQSRRPPAEDVEATEATRYDGGELLQDQATPEQQLLRHEVERTLAAAIDGLAEDLRLAITLREFEGMTYEEIAAVMECPIGTVRSRIFRAREAINSQLEPLLK